MSWDILIMDLPREAQTVSDLPDDFEPRPLGSRNDLITAIVSVAPTADFPDPSWGHILAGDAAPLQSKVVEALGLSHLEKVA